MQEPPPAAARRIAGRLVTLLLTVVAVSTLARQSVQPRAAEPVEPIAAILSAFRSHSIVAFSDPHGNRQLTAFGLAVVRDPRIAAVVNDIVVENGNASYQDVMDRYIRGEDVSYAELRPAWENTTQSQTLGPRDGVIPEIYRAVRAVNAGLPRERHLRVLLGDPPIDWNAVRTEADVRKWIELRDSHAAEVVRREVLAKQRRGLVLYGQGHLQRKNLLANYESEGLAATVISTLEAAGGTKAFTIWWFTDRKAFPLEVASWPVPSVALLRGTTLGAADFTEYENAPPARAAIKDGRIVPVPRDQWRSLRMEDQFDAVLYLGTTSGTFVVGRSELTPAHCADAAYLAEWTRRLALSGPGRTEAERLKQYCAAK